LRALRGSVTPAGLLAHLKEGARFTSPPYARVPDNPKDAPRDSGGGGNDLAASYFAFDWQMDAATTSVPSTEPVGIGTTPNFVTSQMYACLNREASGDLSDEQLRQCGFPYTGMCTQGSWRPQQPVAPAFMTIDEFSASCTEAIEELCDELDRHTGPFACTRVKTPGIFVSLSVGNSNAHILSLLLVPLIVFVAQQLQNILGAQGGKGSNKRKGSARLEGDDDEANLAQLELASAPAGKGSNKGKGSARLEGENDEADLAQLELASAPAAPHQGDAK